MNYWMVNEEKQP